MKFASFLAVMMIAAMNQHPAETHSPPLCGRVIGIGGVFFESAHPDQLPGWYERHLGFKPTPGMGVVFPWAVPGEPGKAYRTTWAVFPPHAKYFAPSKSSTMINYIVDDLDAILARLKSEGVRIDEKRETDQAGRFAWVYDSDGNKIELWEPAH